MNPYQCKNHDLMFRYNHATSNLAIYSNETSKDRLSEAYNRQSIIVIHVYENCMKSWSFLHPHFTETMKVMRICFKKKPTVKNLFIEKKTL